MHQERRTRKLDRLVADWRRIDAYLFRFSKADWEIRNARRMVQDDLIRSFGVNGRVLEAHIDEDGTRIITKFDLDSFSLLPPSRAIE